MDKQPITSYVEFLIRAYDANGFHRNTLDHYLEIMRGRGLTTFEDKNLRNYISWFRKYFGLETPDESTLQVPAHWSNIHR